MQLLDETQALTEIRKILEVASEAKLAVAFWGVGALIKMGLDRTGLDLTIICNLDSGACNPAEIGTIIKKLPKDRNRVFSNPRLHAKVYWTPGRAIIGSSNASANGLAIEGEALNSWAEANVLIDDKPTLDQIERWFKLRLEEPYPNETYLIEKRHLELAQKRWDERKRSAPSGMRMTGDFVEAFRHSPKHPSWSQVKLAFWTDPISKAGEREAGSLRSENPALKNLDKYENWGSDLKAGEYLIDFAMASGEPVFDGIYRVTEFSGPTITFVKQVTEISLPGLPPLELTKIGEKALFKAASRIFDKHARGETNVLVSFAKAMAQVDD